MLRKRALFVLVICLMLILIAPTAMAADDHAVSLREIDGVQYFCASDIESISDISVTEYADSILLAEDGLELHLSADSTFVYRDEYIIANMKTKPISVDGHWYLSADFYNHFLCDNDRQAPSLFHNAMFFPEEVLGALYGTDDEPDVQKLLVSVSLPTSMGINAPHIDMGRIFNDKPLSEYPDILSAEMRRLGVKNPEALAYSEYVVINGAQTLTSAGMSDVVETYPELKSVDPNVMTVAEYIEWQQKHTQQQFENNSSSAAQFAAEKGITISDLSHLYRYFHGSYASKSNSELRTVLQQYYATNISYLQSMCQPFEDVSEEDWFFDVVMFTYFHNLMNGTSSTMFQPHAAVSRAQIVTIFWRMEGSPIVNDLLQFEDVNEDVWYSESIRWASSNGIVKGYGNKFDPADPITREQFAAFLWRYAKAKNMDVTVGTDANTLSYTDAFDISEYAVEAMQWACGTGILKGSKGFLLPGNTATRAEAAAMIHRFCGLFE